MDTLAWAVFFGLVGALLVLDLFLHREDTSPTISHALMWSGFWISLALLFNVWVYFYKGSEAALNFLAGYLVEKSLSVDNIFVFLVIFKAFQIPPKYRHKILFFGVLGAIVMRAIFIVGGIALVSHFSWSFYVFGLFLILTGIKIALQKDEEIHPEKNPIILYIQKWMPLTHSCESGKFFVNSGSKRQATPLFLALIAIELSDLVFAIDSVPAILGITTDLFIVFTSNIFAILGMRSLYFALEGLADLFHYLHYGLAAILIFIGCKMVLMEYIHVPITLSLGVIGLLLGASLVASLIFPKKISKNE